MDKIEIRGRINFLSVAPSQDCAAESTRPPGAGYKLLLVLYP